MRDLYVLYVLLTKLLLLLGAAIKSEHCNPFQHFGSMFGARILVLEDAGGYISNAD